MRLLRRFYRNSISVKMQLAYVAGMFLSVSLIALVVLAALGYQNNILSESDINDFSAEIAEELKFNAAGLPLQVADEEYFWLFEKLSSEIAYRVLDDKGDVALASKVAPEFWAAADQLPLKAGPFEFTQNGILMDAATGLRVENGKSWYCQVAVSRRFMFFAHDAFALRFIENGLILLSLVLFFVFGVCVHFALGYTLRPLHKLSQAAASISPRSLQERLQEDHVPTEIAPLVRSFNIALERLERGYRLQQEFLATAAHELKTPLALIRAQLELMQENAERDWLLSDVKYMSRQVQQLLLLTEVSEEQNYKFSAVEPASVAVEVLSYLQRMADAAGVKLLLKDQSSAAVWQADKGALFTLLKNLVENAIQHAPAGTEVLLIAESDQLTVRDFGPGVTEQDLTQLFNRFWRGEHRRDIGAGLGLAICQEIAVTHRWTLSAFNADPGLVFNLSHPTLQVASDL